MLSAGFDRELLILGFSITEKEVLKRLQEIWSKSYRVINGRRMYGRSKEDTKLIKSDVVGGAIELVDPESMVVLSAIAVRSPMGLCYLKNRQTLYVASDHWISCVSNGAVESILHNNFFNCIHGLSESLDGNLLVVSTGIDAILKLDIDRPGYLLDSWFATENGYDISANGERRYIDRSSIYQNVEFSTQEHTTHINSVLEYAPGQLIATFFHQGELAEINLKNGIASTVLNGLQNPHAVKPSSSGYMVSDTNGKRVILLDKGFKIMGEIFGSFDWVQDAIELRNGNFALADANNGRVVVVNSRSEVINEYVYGAQNKRIATLMSINESEAKKIFLWDD